MSWLQALRSKKKLFNSLIYSFLSFFFCPKIVGKASGSAIEIILKIQLNNLFLKIQESHPTPYAFDFSKDTYRSFKTYPQTVFKYPPNINCHPHYYHSKKIPMGITAHYLLQLENCQRTSFHPVTVSAATFRNSIFRFPVLTFSHSLCSCFIFHTHKV